MIVFGNLSFNDLLIKNRQSLMERWINNINDENIITKNNICLETVVDLFNILYDNLLFTEKLNIELKANLFANNFIKSNNKTTIELLSQLLVKAKSEFNNLIMSEFPNDENINDVIIKTNDFIDAILLELIKIGTKLFEKEQTQLEHIVNDVAHNERLSLIGQMTSSFVHDFKNPLTVIKGFIQLLENDQPNNDYLKIISNEINNLNEQLAQFLLLSKKEKVDKSKSVYCLNKLLSDLLTFLYPSINESNINLTSYIQNDLTFYGNDNELKQVIMNLIFNAIEALESYDNIRLLDIYGYDDEQYTYIEVVNNGPAIPEHLFETIFKPFVTSKKKGTGLGLFICKRIMLKLDGSITCSSSHELTTFTVKAPKNRPENLK